MRCFFILFLVVHFCACQSPIDDSCDISYKRVSEKFNSRTKILFESDSIIEIADFREDSVFGGYYLFREGKLESYMFFTNNKISKDSSKEIYSYVYSEDYSTQGNFRSFVGSPLVYKVVSRVGSDSIKIKAYIFGLNKVFQKLIVQSNTGYRDEVVIKDDTTFSNMMKAEFVFNFRCSSNIELYFEGKYFNKCFSDTTEFTDTLSLEFNSNKLKQRLTVHKRKRGWTWVPGVI